MDDFKINFTVIDKEYRNKGMRGIVYGFKTL